MNIEKGHKQIKVTDFLFLTVLIFIILVTTNAFGSHGNSSSHHVLSDYESKTSDHNIYLERLESKQTHTKMTHN